ncbi:MAG: transcription-repair coupling factor, partial [Pirellulaceae bacterium]|nr:transcription-repair coupling factor [Pirellulaceae bacterium]
MAQAARETDSEARLSSLVERLAAQEGFAEIVAELEGGHAATLDGVWGSSCALVGAALARRSPGPLILVCPQTDDIDAMVDDLRLFTRFGIESFPAWESALSERVIHDEAFADRVRVMKLLESESPPKLLVTSIQSLLQPVPDPASLAARTRTLRVGKTLALDDFVRWMVEGGFHHTTAVELPGECAIRGGIVDIFAPDWFDPVRMELFGDQVESLRRFDVASQRSLAEFDQVDVTMLDPNGRHAAHMTDYLPGQSWFLLVEPGQLEDEGRNYLRRLERPDEAHSVSDVLARVLRFPSVTASAIATGSLEETCRLRIESVERFSGDIERVREELDTVGGGQDVFIVCPTAAEVERLNEVFGTTELARSGRLHFPIGALKAGFRLVTERIVMIGSGELFRRHDLQRPAQRRLGRAIDSFLELREGDLVVHVGHGIARYRGMKLLEKGQQLEEHLELQFDGGTRLYVPSSKIG